MMNVQNLMEYQLQQQIAYEIYRQQIVQRIPDPFIQMLPIPMSPSLSHTILQSHSTLPGCVEANLENKRLWQQFHEIGTEMIITKNGRRMFPSISISLKGLEQDAHYCLLLEMLPIGECRFKYSGSQWLAAGGAEPQSPQRMFLHPDSPASGAHWESQNITFNKIKLTNNTLDNNGHIVLASMHKYQPRLHVIKTKDLTELPWAPQKDFLFPETEFIAVTAYQNDRITKLKIDNNPFAKGFRESGQSKCKRKLLANNSSYRSSSSSLSSSSSSLSPALFNDDTEDDSGSAPSTDAMGKRMRSSATSKLNISDDTIYKCYAMDQFYLRPSSFQALPTKYLTNFNTSDTGSMYKDFYSSVISNPSQSTHVISPTYYNANYSGKADSNDCCQRQHIHQTSISYLNGINDTNTNTNRDCLESTTVIATKSIEKTNNNRKKSNFSISAILAY